MMERSQNSEWNELVQLAAQQFEMIVAVILETWSYCERLGGRLWSYKAHEATANGWWGESFFPNLG